MYKSTGLRYVGTMSSAAANSTLTARMPVGTLPAVPKFQVGNAPDHQGSRRFVEVMLASDSDSDSMTCEVYAAKSIYNAAGTRVGYTISSLVKIACDCASDQSGILGTAAGVTDPYIGNTYTATAASDATTPKGVGTAVDNAYNGGYEVFSPTDGGDGRVIIMDCGNAEWLLFDVYGSGATSRYVFVEAGV